MGNEFLFNAQTLGAVAAYHCANGLRLKLQLGHLMDEQSQRVVKQLSSTHWHVHVPIAAAYASLPVLQSSLASRSKRK